MGIKKTGKKLVKLGKKAARRIGKGGGEMVETILETAIATLRTELEKRGAARKEAAPAKKEPAKTAAKGKRARPSRHSLSGVPSQGEA